FGAGLFIRTLRNLQHVDYGFDASNLLLFDVNPSLNGYKGENLGSVYQRIAEQIDAVPGVQSTTISMFPLMKGWEWVDGRLFVFGAENQPNENASIYLLPVKENFFAAMKIPILLGRSLNAKDNAGSTKAAVVNQAFAKLAFKDEDPIGR